MAETSEKSGRDHAGLRKNLKLCELQQIELQIDGMIASDCKTCASASATNIFSSQTCHGHKRHVMGLQITTFQAMTQLLVACYTWASCNAKTISQAEDSAYSTSDIQRAHNGASQQNFSGSDATPCCLYMSQLQRKHSLSGSDLISCGTLLISPPVLGLDGLQHGIRWPRPSSHRHQLELWKWFLPAALDKGNRLRHLRSHL